jgi:hypothetical protein
MALGAGARKRLVVNGEGCWFLALSRWMCGWRICVLPSGIGA